MILTSPDEARRALLLRILSLTLADAPGDRGGSYCILLYLDVSCVYPVEYMYPECILMYLKCILNALLQSKRMHVS